MFIKMLSNFDIAKVTQLRTICLSVPSGQKHRKELSVSQRYFELCSHIPDQLNDELPTLLDAIFNGTHASTDTPTWQNIWGAHFFRFAHTWYSIMGKII